MAAEPVRPEPVLRNGRGHNSERPVYRKNKTKQSRMKGWAREKRVENGVWCDRVFATLLVREENPIIPASAV